MFFHPRLSLPVLGPVWQQVSLDVPVIAICLPVNGAGKSKS